MTGTPALRGSPLVSVVLPARNRAETIEVAIRSVLDQSYKELEVVVVDDGSDDDTAEVVASLGSRRVRLIRHPRQRGAAAARNTGIEAGRGRLIAFQDSDDRWYPGKLELQVKCLTEQSEEVGVVYGGFNLVSNEGVKSFPPRLIRLAHLVRLPGHTLDGRIRSTLLRGNVVTSQAALVRRRCIEQAGGFDSTLVRFDDWDLWLRIARHHKFAFVDRPLVEVRLSEDSLSTDVSAAVADLARMAAKYPDWSRSLGAVSNCIQAENWIVMGEMRQGREHLARAVRLAPGNASYWMALAASMVGRRFADAVGRRSGLGYRRG